MQTSDMLRENASEIATSWSERIAVEIPRIDAHYSTDLIEPVSDMIAGLAEHLVNPTRDWPDDDYARIHGSARAALPGYRLPDLLHEFGALRNALLALESDRQPFNHYERGLILDFLDRRQAKVCMEFEKRVHESYHYFVLTTLHDIKQPLAGLMLINSRISSRCETCRPLATRSQNVVEQLRTTVEQLLSPTEEMGGDRLRAEMELEPVDVVSVVRDTTSEYEHVNVEADPDTSIPAHLCPNALRRAIGNLVDNALKYGEPGRDVTVTVARLEHHVAISVHNDGNPLGPDDLEKIFQPHQRLSRDRAKPGRGLGLSLVKSVAEAHGGEIRALSNADHGTEFVLTLPLDLPLGRLVDELPRQSA